MRPLQISLMAYIEVNEHCAWGRKLENRNDFFEMRYATRQTNLCDGAPVGSRQWCLSLWITPRLSESVPSMPWVHLN
jgi:hypothetical protein